MNKGKLDARFKGYDNFKYYTGFRYNEMPKFDEIRQWCWEQFGPSCEITIHHKIPTANHTWCWILDDYRARIYFATDKEYQWFLLKWF
jgi:hypothetical protein